MAQYQQIGLDEFFPGFLKPEKGWQVADVPHALEHVFDWPVSKYPGVVIRVYSSIRWSTSTGRRVGSDAIRVCAVDLRADRGIIKAKRVHRVQGWKDNLLTRIMHVHKETLERMAEREQKGWWRRPFEMTPYETPTFTIPTFRFKKLRRWWFRMRLASDDPFALHALEVIFSRQTASEQDAGVTVDANGVGFSGVDAELLTSFAKQWEEKRERYGSTARLSVKQMAWVLRKMPKYWEQVISYFDTAEMLAVEGGAA